MSRVSPAALAAAKKVLTTEGRIAPLNDETLAEVLEAALAVPQGCRPESEAIPVPVLDVEQARLADVEARASQLCDEVEKLPASPEQTKLSLLASNLLRSARGQFIPVPLETPITQPMLDAVTAAADAFAGAGDQAANDQHEAIPDPETGEQP